MKGSVTTDLGVITIDPEVVAKYAGTVAVECFGIVGMAAISMKDGIVKLLKKSVKIVETSLDIYKLITENLEDYRMDRDAQKFLIDRTLNNYERVNNELEKLKLYKYDSKVITKEDVEAFSINNSNVQTKSATWKSL